MLNFIGAASQLRRLVITMNDFFNSVSNFFTEYSIYINAVLGIIIFAVLFFLRNKLSKFLLKLTGKIIFNKTEKKQKRELLISSLQKPMSAFFVLLGIFSAVYLNVKSQFILHCFKIGVILILCWGLVNYLSDNLFLFFHFGKNADDKMNTTAIKFISNILKVLVIAFAVLMIMSELGFNVNGFITGLGVGGLAVSLAAKDALSNLICGFVIVFEKPFIVGEFIKTGSVQGYVEEVAMRATKIKTLDGSIVTVPNSSIANGVIENVSRSENKHIELTFGLVYSSSAELVDKCKNDIREYLESSEDIRNYPIRVYVSQLADSSVNITVFCDTVTSDNDEYSEVLSSVNVKIKEIIENNGAEFAYPTNSVIIER